MSHRRGVSIGEALDLLANVRHSIIRTHIKARLETATSQGKRLFIEEVTRSCKTPRYCALYIEDEDREIIYVRVKRVG